ncbi:MAG: helix-turn-helix domain-containing protein [Myxococcota bacterium]
MRPKLARSVLEPGRLQILARLAEGPATAAELHEHVDCSRPTLYRALEELAERGLIHVHESRPVRGTVERTWRLAVEREALTRIVPEPSQLGEALTSVFAAFVAAPARRVDTPEEICAWVRASAVKIFVTEDELECLRDRLAALLLPYLQPRPRARPLHLTLFAVPTPGPTPGPSPGSAPGPSSTPACARNV